MIRGLSLYLCYVLLCYLWTVSKYVILTHKVLTVGSSGRGSPFFSLSWVEDWWSVHVKCVTPWLIVCDSLRSDWSLLSCRLHVLISRGRKFDGWNPLTLSLVTNIPWLCPRDTTTNEKLCSLGQEDEDFLLRLPFYPIRISINVIVIKINTLWPFLPISCYYLSNIR